MIDTTPDGRRKLRDESLELRRVHASVWSQIVRALAGSDYRSDWTTVEQAAENHMHEIAVNTYPTLFHGTPRLVFECEMLEADHPAVRAMNAGLNRWVRSYIQPGQLDLDRTMELIAFDHMAALGCGLLVLGSVPDAEYGVSLLPRLHRISPARVGLDPLATNPWDHRYIFHEWVAYKDDLLSTGLYNAEAVEEVGAADANDLFLPGLEPNAAEFPQEGQIAVCEFWDAATGVAYTMGSRGSQQQDIREPRTPDGMPSAGPYCLFMGQPVLDQPYPLSHLQVAMGLAREMHAHESQASKDAASQKRIHISNGEVDGIAQVLTQGEHNGLYVIPGFNPQMVTTIDMPGASRQTLDWVERLTDKLDKQIGLTETRRGNITGSTATEIEEATAGQDARSKVTQSRFQRGFADAALRVAEMMWENPGVRFWCRVPGPRGRMVPLMFQGGPMPGKPPIPFGQLGACVKIMPFTGTYTPSPVRTRQVDYAIAKSIEIIQAGRALPELKVPNALSMLYEAANIADGGEQIVDMEMLYMREEAEKALLLGGAGATGPGGPGAPGAGGAPPGAGPEQPTEPGAPAGSPESEDAALAGAIAGI